MEHAWAGEAHELQILFPYQQGKTSPVLVSIRSEDESRVSVPGASGGEERRCSRSGGSCWSRRGGFRESCWWSCSAFSSSGCSPTAPTWRKPPTPKRVVDPQGAVLYTGGRHPEGPAGLPAQRPHGVRVGVRSRRLPRTGLHRRLPAPGLELRHQRSWGAAVGLARSQQTVEDFRTNRYDERSGTLTLTAAQAAAFRRLVVRYYSRFFSDSDDRSTACAGRRSRIATSCGS